MSAAVDLTTLMQLEKTKRQLTQQIFFLDLHQKATFKQYQKIIAKIGAFNPSSEPRRSRDQTIPDIRLPFTRDVQDRTRNLRAKLQQGHALFQQKSEKIACSMIKMDVIAKVGERPVVEDSSPEVDQTNLNEREQEILAIRSREVNRRIDLEKRIKRNTEEIKLLIALESKLQEEFAGLCEAGKNLVRQRKWRLGVLSDPRPITWSIYREHDSFT
jgi:hypothetical protein